MKFLSVPACTIALLAVGVHSFASDNRQLRPRQAGSMTGKVQPQITYTNPYIDVDEWRDTPLRHRYVHGGFNGTELRFSYYFPPKELYKGRFFQGLPAVSGNEHVILEPVSLGAIIADVAPFAFETGGYVVESNQGRANMFPGDDATITGYRGSAAAATFSRTVAEKMYGPHRAYGYVFGGSGGGYKTMACIENSDVWDGAAPFIVGSPISIPNVFTIQAHAMRILGDKFPQIVESLEPGGSGDMYKGLNSEEREALMEVTKMGFPPPAWFKYNKIAMGYTGVFAALLDTMVMMDPTYFTDFWSKPGYLGYNPPESLKKARISHNTTIARIVMTKEAMSLGLAISMSGKFGGGLDEVPAAVLLSSLPGGNIQGASIIVESGAAKGSTVYASGMQKNLTLIGFGAMGSQNLAKLKVGDSVKVDNTAYLASQTYHRHQNPGPEYPVWNQFQTAGVPNYPQRAVQMHKMSLSGTGTMQTGKFNGKVILIESMLDEAAFPWQADWYRMQVKKNYGAKADERFRLWMVDKCMHTSPSPLAPGESRPAESARIVSYTPVIQQALRDLTQWVEKGVAPPPNTNYTVSDGQILLPELATQRLGIQPVVTLVANKGLRADIKVGSTVEFRGTISIPPATGKVVQTELDIEGDGTFPILVPFTPDGENSATVSYSHTFTKTGTYFPALRGVSQRSSNVSSPFGRAVNLGRVRIVVT